ncbi:MAG: N-6 DNA methylase [Anaerolineales bacterium]|nr:N-6 DNA methylase [Anaerolineales bacterium]
MSTRPFHNRLNDLQPKDWIKFQKSWFIHNPPPRKKDVLRHPAKFPESLVQQFIEFFTKGGMNVLDPMLGTGSTLIACIRSGRNGFGVEINPKYAEIAQNEVDNELAQLNMFREHPKIRIIHGDAVDIPSFNLPMIDYCITSPPYWDMLRMRGADTQKKRRGKDELDVYYSDDPNDLGNIEDYEAFLGALVNIYQKIFEVMRNRAYLTIIVKNVKKQGKMFPLAWDIGKEVGKIFTLKDEKIWCQDDIRLAPYGLGNAWVSNTFHHYCLQFRKEVE